MSGRNEENRATTIEDLGKDLVFLSGILKALKNEPDSHKKSHEDYTLSEQSFIAILEDVLNNVYKNKNKYEYTDGFKESLGDKWFSKIGNSEIEELEAEVQGFLKELSDRINLGNQGTSISKISDTDTVDIDLKNGWIYLGTGRFKAKKDATLSHLKKYGINTDADSKNYTMSDSKGEQRSTANPDLIFPGDEVQFPLNFVHSIEDKLEGDGYEFITCGEDHIKTTGTTRDVYIVDISNIEVEFNKIDLDMTKMLEDVSKLKAILEMMATAGKDVSEFTEANNLELVFWVDEENKRAGWHPASIQKYFGYANFFDDVAQPIFGFKIGEITLDMGTYVIRLWHGDYGAAAGSGSSKDNTISEEMKDWGLGAETGVYNTSNGAADYDGNNILDGEEGIIRDTNGETLQVPTFVLEMLTEIEVLLGGIFGIFAIFDIGRKFQELLESDELKNVLDGSEKKGITKKIEDFIEKYGSILGEHITEELGAILTFLEQGSVEMSIVEIIKMLTMVFKIKKNIRQAIKDMETDWGHSLSPEELEYVGTEDDPGPGILSITTELWILDEGRHIFYGAVTENGNWPNLYTMDHPGEKKHVDSVHTFRLENEDMANNFFNKVEDAIGKAGKKDVLQAYRVGTDYVRLEWFDK